MDSMLSAPVYRYVETMTFHDTSRALIAKVDFLREQEKGSISKFFGKKDAPEPEFNKILITIMKREPGKEVLIASGVGNWARFVAFDGLIFWQWKDPVPKVEFEPFGPSLPSCSLRRKELVKIANKQYAEADK
jgi:hypothetical protein